MFSSSPGSNADPTCMLTSMNIANLIINHGNCIDNASGLAGKEKEKRQDIYCKLVISPPLFSTVNRSSKTVQTE